jgi:putative transposase
MANYSALFVHLVWVTAERRPWITAEASAGLYACVASKCRQLHCRPLAIGGMPDHIHLVVELRPTVAVATLVKEAKGASSYHMTHVLLPEMPFSWQVGYGALTFRRTEVPIVTDYVRRQREHHAARSLIGDLERLTTSTRSPL